ncbi:glycosyltransferase [Sphingobacterium sp. Mn56C]|uniref:glycosyltransferase n=1 Tax=Sphingobacterium sp. Mn56C TaxID=3395261 RepID=UPI003BC21E50
MKTIVISAVNLVEAGTLAILKDCLQYLSGFVSENPEYRVVAIVYKKELAHYPNIEYIETQWPKKRWINRLWYEYVSMGKIAKEIAPVYLWFSLHDTTPTVAAERRAVYCHNSYSFYKWKIMDFFFTPKIALFSLFTKYIYKPNIQRNNYLVVQQYWFREAMSKMFAVRKDNIIVAPPQSRLPEASPLTSIAQAQASFIFAGSPNSHKNFEVIAKAVKILELDWGLTDFSVYLTVKGDENNYAKWLYKNWGEPLKNLHFIGFLSKEKLFHYYEKSSCLIFPSKIETWGLPISEYANYNKPMLLADLPYAHETAEGASKVAFFDVDNPMELAQLMQQVINQDLQAFCAVEKSVKQEPYAKNWAEVFSFLLKDNKNLNT